MLYYLLLPFNLVSDFINMGGVVLLVLFFLNLVVDFSVGGFLTCELVPCGRGQVSLQLVDICLATA